MQGGFRFFTFNVFPVVTVSSQYSTNHLQQTLQAGSAAGVKKKGQIVQEAKASLKSQGKEGVEKINES